MIAISATARSTSGCKLNEITRFILDLPSIQNSEISWLGLLVHGARYVFRVSRIENKETPFVQLTVHQDQHKFPLESKNFRSPVLYVIWCLYHIMPSTSSVPNYKSFQKSWRVKHLKV